MPTPAQLVVICASSSDSSLLFYDLSLKKLVNPARKPTQTHSQCFAMAPRSAPRIFLAAQQSKPLIHVFSLEKEQPILKFSTVEPLTALALSTDARYCAGGTASGRIYLWEVNSGNLCNSWLAHYQEITLIRFTDDQQALITASKDANIHVYLLFKLLRSLSGATSLEEGDGDKPLPQALCNGHTLGITDLQVSFATPFNESKLVSASLDRTCKIWHLPTGNMLVNLVFPGPIQSVHANRLFTTLFAGSMMEGKVWTVALHAKPTPTSDTSSSIYGNNNTTRVINDDKQEAIFQVDQSIKATCGHLGKITDLDTTLDGTLLISAGEEGRVLTWDVYSRQLVNWKQVAAKGPVTFAKICELPPPSPPSIKAFKKAGIDVTTAEEVEGQGTIRLFDQTSIRLVNVAKTTASTVDTTQVAASVDEKSEQIAQLKQSYNNLKRKVIAIYSAEVSKWVDQESKREKLPPNPLPSSTNTDTNANMNTIVEQEREEEEE